MQKVGLAPSQVRSQVQDGPSEAEKAKVRQLIQEELGQHYSFTLAKNVPIEMSFRDVTIWNEYKEGPICNKQKKQKLILNSVSGQFKAGTSTAILGSSGSGKTTLLNYLSSRMQDSVLKSCGELYINGHQVPSIKPIKHRTGYITQVDVVYDDLTPEEQFRFTAKLSGVKNPDEKVRELINMLGLKGCKDTRVGNDLERGISGGERKRTSIGIELITDPSLLFLDEPTTGLDSKSALDLALLLKKLSENGRTIVSTIHCPSAEILATFDNVLCLSRGEIIYYGSPSNIPKYFAEIGFPAPAMTNPADHLMTIIHEDDIRIKYMARGEAITEEEVNTKFSERIDLFVKTAKSSMPPPSIEKDSPSPFSIVKANDKNINCLVNSCTMLYRCLLIYFRHPQSMNTKIIQTLGFVAFTLILHHKTISYHTNTLQAILDKGGLAFNISSTQVFAGVFANMYTFLPALPTLRRESQNKLYGPLSWYFVHAFFEFPIQFLMTNLYYLPLFWAVGMRHDSFWVYVQNILAALCARFAAGGIGDLLSLVFKKIEIINQSFPIFVIPLFLVSGFVAQVKTIVIYMVVYSYLSPFRFAFQATMQIEFTSDVVDDYIRNCRVLKPNCPDKNSDACYINYSTMPPSFPRIKECNPLTNYDFYEDKYLWNLLILIAQGIFFRIFAILAVYLFCKETNESDDPIPPGLAQAVAKRRNILYKELTSGAADSALVRPIGRENPNNPTERFVPARIVQQGGGNNGNPRVTDNHGSNEFILTDGKGIKDSFKEEENFESRAINDQPGLSEWRLSHK
jgi:ABC-type multidrug transport system ATPase subunit